MMMVSRRGGRRRRGAAAVEAALVAPVFFTLVFAQLETARLGMVCQLLTVAAREGARVAVINGKTQTDVQAEVSRVLTGSGIPVPTVTPSPSNWQTAAFGTPITVSLSVPYSQVSWFPTPIFFSSNIVTASATMSSERP